MYEVPNISTKVNLLRQLLRQNDEWEKVLVFTGTKKLADWLYEQLEADLSDRLGVIHSNKSQNNRIRTVRAFDEGAYRVLIATDIVARGLDFDNITHVVNFDLPEVPEHYLHRIGRTGRADRAGAAVSFISEREREARQAIEELMQQPIPTEPLPADLVFSEVLLPEEKERPAGDKAYLPEARPKRGQGAFHEKKEKNKKVNRAHEKRQARRRQKRSARRRKK